MTLRIRLFLLVGACVATAVAAVTWTVAVGARQAFEAADTRRTAALIAQFRREFARQSDDVVRRVDRIAAADASQRTFIEIGRHGTDYSPFVNEAESLAAAQELDFLDLIADDGTIISSAHWPARFGYRNDWALQHPSTGAFLQGIELAGERALGLISVHAVTAAGRTLHLAGGRKLDHQFLQSLVLPPDTRAFLYKNLEPEVSRQQLIDASGQVPQSGRLEPLIARVRETGREVLETVEWPDGPESFDALPLTGADHSVLGVLLVGSSGRELAALVSRIRWLGAGFGALGVLAGFALSYVLSSTVTRPVERLARAADDVAAGDWSVRVDNLHATGEIGRLAQAFDTMTTQLVEQRERLVQAERVAAWRELARRLAHELKNPLFPLRITLDNLRRAKTLERDEFDEVFEESLATLGTGLASLNTVVGRFSDFARMPAPIITDISPRDVIEQVVSLFRAQIEAPGQPAIDLALDLDPSPTTIRADGEQLSRVVQNLLLNAIDAMPRGGALTVRTRRMGGLFRLDVSDTGEGLTDEERARLFTPYYTTKRHGTGLGLAIVQSVVADHRGRVWVASESGRGTTFHVELPEGQG